MRAVAAAALAAIAMCAPAAALEIEFDYRFDTNGFFTDLATGSPIAERRAVLEAAAGFFAPFADPLAAIDPGAGDRWRVRIVHPSLAGAAPVLDDLRVAGGAIRVFVGASASVPGVLGFATTGFALEASGSDSFVSAVTTRGQSVTAGPGARDYGPWGGSIWFNSANDWHFGLDTAGLFPGRPDLLTTATHELGHILGFGVAASWFAQVDTANRFTGAASMALHGGPVALDSIAAHWAEGTISTRPGGAPQETLMDPTTVAGVRELPTRLDYAAWRDIGWQVSAVPEPEAAWLTLVGLAATAFAARRRRAGADRTPA